VGSIGGYDGGAGSTGAGSVGVGVCGGAGGTYGGKVFPTIVVATTAVGTSRRIKSTLSDRLSLSSYCSDRKNILLNSINFALRIEFFFCASDSRINQ